MKGTNRRLLILIVGMALIFTWTFCAFPTTDTFSVLQARFDGTHYALLRMATVGMIPALLLPLFSRWIEKTSHFIVICIFGCISRLVGSYIDIVAFQLEDPFVPLLVGAFMMGIGTSIALILWGILLHHGDTESNEQTFIATFIATGTFVAIMGLLPHQATTIILFIIPLIELVCYCWASKEIYPPTETMPLQPSRIGKDFALLFVRSCIAITLVGFIWEMFATATQEFAYPKQSVFGVGLIASALIIWLFTKYSPNVGFVAATRWALPIMALGLLLCAFASPLALIIACLLLAGGQGSLETILRMQTIEFSRQKQYDPVQIIGWGYAAIMAGAFLGPSSFHLLGLDSGKIDHLLIIVILTVLVVISSLIFSTQSVQKQSEHSDQSYDVTQRAGALSSAYGLSPRETEILEYLLEGRSHPYIRDVLFISKSTVDTHVHHIYAKTGVNSKQALIDLSKQTK